MVNHLNSKYVYIKTHMHHVGMVQRWMTGNKTNTNQFLVQRFPHVYYLLLL